MGILHAVYGGCTKVNPKVLSHIILMLYYRRWCPCLATCCHTIRTAAQMVFSLSGVPSHCNDQHCISCSHVSLQDSRRCVRSLLNIASPDTRSITIECLAQIGQAADETGISEESKIRQIVRIRAVHLLALFILVYVGVEVTIAGRRNTFGPLVFGH